MFCKSWQNIWHIRPMAIFVNANYILNLRVACNFLAYWWKGSGLNLVFLRYICYQIIDSLVIIVNFSPRGSKQLRLRKLFCLHLRQLHPLSPCKQIFLICVYIFNVGYSFPRAHLVGRFYHISVILIQTFINALSFLSCYEITLITAQETMKVYFPQVSKQNTEFQEYLWPLGHENIPPFIGAVFTLRSSD